MSPAKPYTLSIAGFDPSGGAGLLADSKTFGANDVYGLGVCTAITVQHDTDFRKVYWTEPHVITEQTDILAERFPVHHVKIGLVQNLHVLEKIINNLITRIPQIHITWDPILSSSTGQVFHEDMDFQQVTRICRQIGLITPNTREAMLLTGKGSAEEAARLLATCCPVLLKGGHTEGDRCTDILFTDTREIPFEEERITGGEKHGSGCTLSAAVTANLAKGYGLPEACSKAISYTRSFLASTTELIGYHS